MEYESERSFRVVEVTMNLVEPITCHGCKQEFVPETEYVFPNYYVYWHECKPGVLTQNTKAIEKKYNRYIKLEYIAKENVNRLLMSFHNPSFRKICNVDDENNYNGRNY